MKVENEPRSEALVALLVLWMKRHSMNYAHVRMSALYSQASTYLCL